MIDLNVNVASKIRTKASATLLRDISIADVHNMLMAMFVNRYELQDKVLKETKQDWIDRCLTFDNEYRMHEHCFLMHKSWNSIKRLAINEDWQDLFVEDEKGGNNAW